VGGNWVLYFSVKLDEDQVKPMHAAFETPFLQSNPKSWTETPHIIIIILLLCDVCAHEK